jgi:predicted Zn-dependent peptidase
MSINRSIAPPIRDITSFNIIHAKKHELPNNIQLYQVNTGIGDLVKIEWMFPAGSWYQTWPLTAYTVNNMLVEGTQHKKSLQIAELVEYYGAYLSCNIDKDNAFVTLVCMHKYIGEVMEVVADIIQNATFPEHELDIFRNKHKQQFLVEQSIMKNIARFVHFRMLFGNNHPYGYMIVEDDFDKTNRDELLRFHKCQYQAKNCRIIVSGKADDHVLKILEKYFGLDQWNATDYAYPSLPAINTEKERSIYINKPEAVQSAVRIGKVLINKMHPDFTGVNVLTCILGGYMGSRLMKKIREEKGYTYGINSLLVTFKNAGYLTIASELGAHVTSNAIADIFTEIETLRNEAVMDEELQRVKNYMLGDVARMFDGPFAQAESLISLLEYDLEYDYFDRMINTIKNIKVQDVQSLAVKYLSPDSFSQVVVGKMD